MKQIRQAVFDFLFHSPKGRDALSQVAGLVKFGHFGEAASVARQTLDENPTTSKKIPEITSGERKLLSGSYLANKAKADECGQIIPNGFHKIGPT